MFDTFDECTRALLEDDKLDEAKGGLITKDNGGFNYSLHNQPEAEGESFVGIYPSATPEVKWRAMFYGGEEAAAAYRAFVASPENGDLYQA